MNACTPRPALLTALCAALLLSSCNHADRETPEPSVVEEQQTAADGSYAQAAYDDALRLAGEAERSAQASATAGPVTSSCAQLTLDRAAGIVTLDFGSAGCTGPDGRVRKGKITVTYQGGYLTPGSQTVLTFAGYSVDNNAVGGTVTLSGVSRNAAGKLQYTTTVAGGSLALANGGGTLLADLARTTEWTTGEGTGTAQDDVFAIVTAGTLTWRNGVAYAVTTPSPLLVQSACLSQGIIYPASGTLSLKAAAKPAFGLDYGSGTCDKTATLTVGPTSRVITLP
ncbi:hypothetical protein [Hymenobacter sp.]|uniref:hypothetical protein n=1 Tax=Hymenobacter sp. TaxID=1898978 RepID=UPI00286AA242|nr:hypothetical protein [Hymenobacter sp.]